MNNFCFVKSLRLIVAVLAVAAFHGSTTARADEPEIPARAGAEKAAAPPKAPVSNPEEQKIFATLQNPTDVDFVEPTFEDAVKYLSDYHRVPIRFDEAPLKAAGISMESSVTLELAGARFTRVLDALLEPLTLDWYVDGPELIVTTRAGAADALRQRLERTFEEELEFPAWICELTDAQKEKLRLAGEGDIRSVLSGIEEKQARFQLVRKDEKKSAELLAEIGKLKDAIRSSPFGHGSLFRKSLENTLTPGQSVKYEPIRAILKVGGTVGMVERGAETVMLVVLAGSESTDGVVASLKGLPGLAVLNLVSSKVTDAGVAHLKDLTNLKELMLDGTDVTNAGLALLKRLTDLRSIGLRVTKITDEGLVHLQGMKNLESLGLSTQITDAGLAHLKGVTTLQSLDLDDTQVTDAGLVHLQGLTNLQDLSLSDTGITGSGLSHLKGLTKLQMISLNNTKVTDAGLIHLRTLKNLEKVFMFNTTVTDEGVEELKRALPEIEVWK